MVWWGFWKDYPKVTLNGKEYAVIGPRLYTHHAVERFLPSARRTVGNVPVADGEGGGHMYHEKARSIPPASVEETIQRGTKTNIVAKEEARRLPFPLTSSAQPAPYQLRGRGCNELKPHAINIATLNTVSDARLTPNTMFIGMQMYKCIHYYRLGTIDRHATR
jgi:hypothetical protein